MYDEDFSNVPPARKGMTKREMEEDLRRAVLNTGGEVVRDVPPPPEPAVAPFKPIEVLHPLKIQPQATRGKPVRGRGGTLYRCPTADEVAMLVIAAAREFEVNPVKVVLGAGPYDARVQKREETLRSGIKRARVYAALAILELFPEAPKAWIASYVGVVSTKSYVWNCEHCRQIGTYDWWSDDAFARVVRAVQGEEHAGED